MITISFRALSNETGMLPKRWAMALKAANFIKFRAEGSPMYQYIGGSSFPEHTELMVPISDGNV